MEILTSIPPNSLVIKYIKFGIMTGKIVIKMDEQIIVSEIKENNLFHRLNWLRNACITDNFFIIRIIW